MIFSLEGYILTFTHVLIAVALEGMQVLIYRSLSDIASSRIGDLETTESREKCRKEKYTDTDLFDFFPIETTHRHLPSIIAHGTSFPGHHDPERLHYREKCEYITDLWDIVKRE